MTTRTLLSSGLAMCLALGCGDDPLSVQDIAGSYQATVFSITTASGTTDLLAGGSTIDITISPSGAVTGQLFVPAALNGGTDFTASMQGTVELSGDRISFDQAADSFFRDAEFGFHGNSLVGTHSDGSGTINVTLTRQ